MTSLRSLCHGAGLAAIILLATQPAMADSAGFSAGVPADQRAALGLDQLSAGEIATLDQLIAADLSQARTLRGDSGRFSQRHSDAERQAAGLGHLSAAQLAELDDAVGALVATRTPKERPRLKDNEVVSLARRLEVHGGMSLTYGWAGGGRNFREVGAWVSYFDPVSGLELALGFSRYSGDAFYDGYPYGYGGGWGYAPVRAYDGFARPTLSDRGGLFAADGGGSRAMLRPAMAGRGGRRF